MELLKQGQYSPFPVENQVVSIWAGTQGYLDDVPVEDISRFESEFLDHLKHKSSILTTLAQTNVLGDDTVEALKTAIVDFKKGFFGEGDSQLVGAGHEEHEAISEGQVDQEKIVRQKR
jgi:F-type H+-transporting ATPase subunit alpha